MAEKILIIRCLFQKYKFRNKYLASLIVLLADSHYYLTRSIKEKNVENFIFIEKKIKFIDRDLIKLAAGFCFEIFSYMTDESERDFNYVFNAAKHGEISTIKYFYKHKNFNYFESDLLYIASKFGQTKVVEFLHKKGVNIYRFDCLAFRIAAGRGHLQTTKFFVQNYVDIHANKNEAIKLALLNKHFEVFKYLRNNGANIIDGCEYLNDYPHFCSEIDCIICWAEKNNYYDAKFFMQKQKNDM